MGDCVIRRNPKGGVTFDWTQAAVERLKAMVLDGGTASEIAAALGCSRNAVIGKVHRLKIRLGDRVTREVAQKAARPAVAAPHGGTLNQRMLARREIAAKAAAVDPATPTVAGWPKPKTETAIHFLSDRLQARHCRMPLWDDATPHESRFYCGAEVVPGKSWCPACMKLVYGQGTPGERDAVRVLKRAAA